MDVVTFGETMVLFNPDQMLKLEYVHQFYKQVAGAESNVAIGLHRLGHSVGWFSKLGSDPFGRFVQRFIRGEGVDTSRCIYVDEAQTGLYFKEKLSSTSIQVYYYRKNSAASRMKPQELDESYIASAKILHLTGITPALSETCLETTFEAIRLAKKHGLKIVFDPNIRLKLWDKDLARKTLLDIATAADYILPGLDEGQLLTGYQEPEDIASFFLQKGSKAAIIKLGDKGAYYQTSENSGYVEGYRVPQVIDPVGAGDGFAAGFISGILRQESIEHAVKRANAVGSIVVGVNGDVEGLPTDEEVTRVLQGKVEGQDVKR